MRMMIIVPGGTQGNQAQEKNIPACDHRFDSARTNEMADRVDTPCHMMLDKNSCEAAPQKSLQKKPHGPPITPPIMAGAKIPNISQRKYVRL
ncbi:MAG: hypothetical protein HC938_17465 [Nitrospira sp.]|nr:hypothetical protein [Nitrospira sp.]